MSGAVDLSILKERAEQQAAASAARSAGSGAGGAAAVAGAVIDVTDATFESDVVERSMTQLVVVDLWATWCQPCKQLSPVLERLAAESGGRWVLAKVDVDANPGIAQAFGVQSVPMVVAIAGGRPADAFAGAQPEAQIVAWLDNIFAQLGDALPGGDGAVPEPPEDPRMAAARQVLDTGDLDGALAAYRAILAAEPANIEARQLVRGLEFQLRALAHDPQIVVNAAPGDVDAQLAAADVLLLGDRPEAAFDRIIAVVASTDGDDRTLARTRLLELFELFDPADPLVTTARRKLTTALF